MMAGASHLQAIPLLYGLPPGAERSMLVALKPDDPWLITSCFLPPQVEDVLRNAERGPGPFVSSTAARAELPHWAATLQWWWRCRLSKWVFR